jgi:hypothetical protein
MLPSGTTANRPTDVQRQDVLHAGAHVEPFAVVRVAVLAGLAAAIIEMVFVLPIQQYLGASPLVVFQSIAAGALGKAAFGEGLPAAALGVAVHVLISLVAAGVFVCASLRWPVLLRSPWVSGILYGVVVYLVMTFVVLPLSAIGLRLPKSFVLWTISFSIHLFAFALPIALVTRRLLRVR